MNYLLRYAITLFAFLALGNLAVMAQNGTNDHNGHVHLPDRPACGTFLYMQLQAEEDNLDEKGHALLGELRTTTRLQLDTSIVSSNGNFRIHYDKSGRRAPSSTDLNQNGIPDYIDSVDYYMEFAWQKELVECGYITPPPDNPRPGTGGIDSRIDVYITELSGQFYGLAFPETNATLGQGRVHGYLHLDNDYKGYPTSGIAGLRVTTAHEFHHIVQFASYRYDLSQASLYESTSTWMEFKVHPDLTDYRFYFNAFLQEPQEFSYATNNTSDGITGYAHMHYLQSLVDQLDETIIKKIWDEFKANGSEFDAIDEALLKTGSGLNLTNSYCTFARWSYYTGTNATDTTYFLKADLYPTMKPVQIRAMPIEGETSFVGSLMPLSFGLWKLTLHRENGFAPDTLDFLITNGRDNLGKGGAQWLNNPDAFTLDVSRTKKANFLPLTYGLDTIYYRLSPSHQNFCIETIVNGSPGITTIARPTPQPFENDGANQILFAVKTGAETVVTSVKLDIYSVGMTPIAKLRESGLQTRDNLKGIAWDGRDFQGNLLPSGVYLYTLQINDQEPSVGKFAIVKK